MNRSVHKSAAQSRTVVDAGLRAYMQKVFSTMGLGLLLTGVTAYFVATTPALVELFLGSPLRWVLLIATFAIPLTIGVGIERLSSGAAQGLFWGYAVLMGVTTSVIFLGYTTDSIARIFLITSCMFGGMSLYGYTTHRDLTAWGSFLFMGLFGLVISSIVNIFSICIWGTRIGCKSIRCRSFFLNKRSDQIETSGTYCRKNLVNILNCTLNILKHDFPNKCRHRIFCP